MQSEQIAQEFPAVEVDCVREESFQEKPLSEDVFVQSVPQEEFLGAFWFEEAYEALRRVEEMEVFLRNHVWGRRLKKEEKIWVLFFGKNYFKY